MAGLTNKILDHLNRDWEAREQVMIRHSLEFDANSSEEAQSLKTAATQLDEAAKCLDVICNNPKGYVAGTQTYPTKKKESGLPLDAFRDFLKSHLARLSNRLAGKPLLPKNFYFGNAKRTLVSSRNAMWRFRVKPWGCRLNSEQWIWSDNCASARPWFAAFENQSIVALLPGLNWILC